VGPDPLRDETVKYLNGEQNVDVTIANIAEQLTEGHGPLP
jgi:alpha-1,4-digalacturonate transport system substrate-binding protein